MRFEWDPQKAAANLAKHGVSFEEAISVFGQPAGHHRIGQCAFGWRAAVHTTGATHQQRVVIVWHADVNDVVRLIGAREVTPRERRIYESGD